VGDGLSVRGTAALGSVVAMLAATSGAWVDALPSTASAAGVGLSTTGRAYAVWAPPAADPDVTTGVTVLALRADKRANAGAGSEAGQNRGTTLLISQRACIDGQEIERDFSGASPSLQPTISALLDQGSVTGRLVLHGVETRGAECAGPQPEAQTVADLGEFSVAIEASWSSPSTTFVPASTVGYEGAPPAITSLFGEARLGRSTAVSATIDASGLALLSPVSFDEFPAPVAAQLTAGLAGGFDAPRSSRATGGRS
jgi:hypothetical protein